MKHAKRMGAVALALLTALPGLGYDPVSFDPALTELGLTETLTVTEPGPDSPAVTYTLTLGAAQFIYNGASYAPGSAPAAAAEALENEILATATFAASAAVYGTPATEDYAAPQAILDALNGLVFDRPYIIWWPITKTVASDDDRVWKRICWRTRTK